MDQLADGLNRAVELAKAELRRQLRPLYGDPVRLREAFEALLPEFVDAFGEVAASAAAEWFEDATGMPAIVAPPVDKDAVVKRAKWAAQPAFRNNPDQAVENLGHAVDEYVKQQGRDTIIESSYRRKVTYARVPTGSETCAFCLMLASRGYVYTAKSSAGWLRKFHHDCDCQIVPNVGATPEGYDPDALSAFYRKHATSGATASTILANIRADLDIK